jgi:hypothetical protein
LPAIHRKPIAEPSVSQITVAEALGLSALAIAPKLDDAAVVSECSIHLTDGVVIVSEIGTEAPTPSIPSLQAHQSTTAPTHSYEPTSDAHQRVI